MERKANLSEKRANMHSGGKGEPIELDDDAKLEVLGRRAGQLGFELPEETGRYLLTRSQRGLADLLELLDGVDRAALAAQRRVTVPFLRDYLASRG